MSGAVEAYRDTIAPQVDAYASTAEELNAMTLQVGLVGSDGVVIASDRLMGQWEGRAFSQMMTSKFLQGEHALCCWSGDSVSQRAANSACGLKPSTDKEGIRRQLKEIGDTAWQELGVPGNVPELVTRKIIVALPASEWPLWVLQVSSSSFANPVLDKVVAGDDRNTARHFSNNYVPCHPPPVENLIVLAAHVILSGGEENPSGVGGLEVAVVRDGGITVLSTAQELELKVLSRRIAKRLKRDLLRPFSVEP